MSPARLRSSCEYTACLMMPARRAGISRGLQVLVWDPFADKAPLVNLAHDLREGATRQRGVMVFLAVSTYQEERTVDHLTVRSHVALANQNSRVVNGLCQAST